MSDIDIVFNKSDKLGRIDTETVRCYYRNQGKKVRNANQSEQHSGIDLIIDGLKYEVKHQTLVDHIIVEDFSMDDIPGWIVTSQSDFLLEVNARHITKINLEQLRALYSKIKGSLTQYTNYTSKGNYGDSWHSKFRILPVAMVSPYIDLIEWDI